MKSCEIVTFTWGGSFGRRGGVAKPCHLKCEIVTFTWGGSFGRRGVIWNRMKDVLSEAQTTPRIRHGLLSVYYIISLVFFFFFSTRRWFFTQYMYCDSSEAVRSSLSGPPLVMLNVLMMGARIPSLVAITLLAGGLLDNAALSDDCMIQTWSILMSFYLI